MSTTTETKTYREHQRNVHEAPEGTYVRFDGFTLRVEGQPRRISGGSVRTVRLVHKDPAHKSTWPVGASYEEAY